jgi:hypothetical protein
MRWLLFLLVEVRMSEYVTCSRCGVVPRGHQCPHKTYRKKERDSQADKFRKSKRWTDKSIEIRQRDKYLCVVCMANLYNTVRQFNYDKLEVHHIEKLTENYDKRLDNDNLVTLCAYHHRMADNGDIPKEVLYELVGE